MNLTVASSPHIRGDFKTRRIMLDVVLALLPALLVGVWMHGFRSVLVVLVSILSCQFISNVPSAILLSRFTGDYHSLLLGVNIGGTGTLIASLASLITFSEYRVLYPGKGGRYFWLFTLINVVFLVIMTVAAKIFFI